MTVRGRLSGGAGTVALCEAGQARSFDPGWLDRLDQLVEGSHHPQCRGLFDAEFVVAAAEVLDECVPGADHPRAAELFQPVHRP